jgi:Domain of unknown function (DUF4167)
MPDEYSPYTWSWHAKCARPFMTTHRQNGSRAFSNRSPSGSRSGPQQGVNAKARYRMYVTLAQAAALTGDAVETENCYQHAEHYYRVMRERTG